MPEPNLNQTHISQALSNLATSVASDEAGFVGLQIAPPFPVQKVSDLIWELDTRTMFRGDENIQGPDGFLPEIAWSQSTDTYRVFRHGFSRFVSDVDENNADAPMKPSRSATRILMRRNLNVLERSILTRMTNASVFTQGTTLIPGTQFNDVGSNPDLVFQVAAETPIVKANAVLIHEQVYNTLRNHSQLKEKYKYTGQGILPDQIIAEVLGVSKIYVSRAKYDSSNKAAATATYGYIMPSKDILFFYQDTAPSMDSMNTAWTFWLQGAPLSAGSKNPFYVKPTPERRRAGGGTYYDCEAWYEEAHIMTIENTYLIKNAVA